MYVTVTTVTAVAVTVTPRRGHRAVTVACAVTGAMAVCLSCVLQNILRVRSRYDIS